MRTRFLFSKQSLILSFCLFLLSHLSFSQSAAFDNLDVRQQFRMWFGDWPLRVDADGSDGGRFFIALNGNVGISNPNPKPNGKSETGYWPSPLANLHVNGSSILAGNTLVSSDLLVANKWINIPSSSTELWGLWIDKGVVATDYAITASYNWADYVFDSTYRLRPLQEVEDFIKVNKHLPDMPSEKKIKEGYTIHDINTRFMQKIEELTLYTIEQDKQIQALQKQVQELSLQVKTIIDASSTKK